MSFLWTKRSDYNRNNSTEIFIKPIIETSEIRNKAKTLCWESKDNEYDDDSLSRELGGAWTSVIKPAPCTLKGENNHL